jgi:hypothetical protein
MLASFNLQTRCVRALVCVLLVVLQFVGHMLGLLCWLVVLVRPWLHSTCKVCGCARLLVWLVLQFVRRVLGCLLGASGAPACLLFCRLASAVAAFNCIAFN